MDYRAKPYPSYPNTGAEIMFTNFETAPIFCHIVVLIPFAGLFFILGFTAAFMGDK